MKIKLEKIKSKLGKVKSRENKIDERKRTQMMKEKESFAIHTYTFSSSSYFCLHS